jgi:hypothetical protein
MRALLAISVLFAAGCATSLGELRAMPPSREMTVSGRHDPLAGCVADGLQTGPVGAAFFGPVGVGALRYQVVRRDDLQFDSITAFLGEAPLGPTFDITFQQQAGERVQIAQRLGAGMTGGVSAEAWKIVERCARATGPK